MRERRSGRGLALQHPADIARGDGRMERHVDDDLIALAAQAQRPARDLPDDGAGNGGRDLQLLAEQLDALRRRITFSRQSIVHSVFGTARSSSARSGAMFASIGTAISEVCEGVGALSVACGEPQRPLRDCIRTEAPSGLSLQPARDRAHGLAPD